MSTKTRISFRAKKTSRQALAAIKTTRLPGRSSPKSIHLGYVSLAKGLTDERLNELDERLQKAWFDLKGYGDILIDRDDARVKWSRATGGEEGGSRKAPNHPDSPPDSTGPVVCSDHVNQRDAEQGVATRRLQKVDPRAELGTQTKEAILKMVMRYLEKRVRFAHPGRHLDYAYDNDDLVMETCMVIWRSINRHDFQIEDWNMSRLRSFALKAMRNVAIDQLRRVTATKRSPSRLQTKRIELEDVAADEVDVAGRIEDQDQIERLKLAIPSLVGDTTSKLVFSVILDGETFSEIAVRIGTSAATVRSRYYRALYRIRNTHLG